MVETEELEFMIKIKVAAAVALLDQTFKPNRIRQEGRLQA